MTVTVTTEEAASYRQVITAANHTAFADMSVASGGEGTAPDPHDLLLAAWGSCTNMTLQLYARRKGWPLEKAETTLHEAREPDGTLIQKDIRLWGDLTPEQVDSLKAIAEKCPINQLVMGGKGRIKQVDKTISLVTVGNVAARQPSVGN